jgi:hypothetical protein
MGDSSEGFSTTVLPKASGVAIGQVGREDLADWLIDESGDLAKQVGREDRLEHAEAERAAGFGGEQADDFHLAALEDVRRLEEQALLGARRRLPPGVKGVRRGLHRSPGVLAS